MKLVYPAVFTAIDEGLLAHVPDLKINTHGKDLSDAIHMTRDAISIWCVAEQDAGRTLPKPSSDVKKSTDDIVTFIDVDIDAYRRKLDSRTVRKNLTLPSWLNEQAEQANINFSRVLQKALQEELQIAN